MVSRFLKGIFFVVAIAAITASGQGLRLDPPYIEGFHPLDAEPQASSPLTNRKPALLRLSTTMFSDTTQIDFEKRQITFRKMDPLGYTMWEFHYAELSDYLDGRRNYSLYSAWKKSGQAMQAAADASRQQGLKLEWELPVQYPSWAQRVLGKEPPKLKIDGFIALEMGYQHTNYEEGLEGLQTQPTSNDFKFDINYSFGISGSVGRLININIRADKEQNFEISDNLKNFKIEYKEETPGELEDEVVQEVIVGYTGFSLPGTQLSGYSESKEGLFGIKVRTKFGPLELTSVACTEQGQSNKKSYNSGAGSSSGAPLDIKSFAKDQYFFLDTTYRRAYIKKYAPNGNSAIKAPKVTEISVWRSFSSFQLTKNQSNIKRVKLDSTENYAQFERLERDVHYYINDEEGYIRLADSVVPRAEQQIAIYYRTTEPTLQRGSTEISTVKDSVNRIEIGDTVFTLWELRKKDVIYSYSQDPERFSLMWRNVYSGANLDDPASFKLTVSRKNADKVTESFDSREDGTFYAQILGLTDKDNKPLVGNRVIFNKTFRELIIPPYDTSDAGLDVFGNPELKEYRNTLIYRFHESHDSVRENKNLWQITMSGSRKQTTFNDLGWDIMPGTEVVKADGATLIRDKDYYISYSDGTLELTSARAKAANKIDVDYQSSALFVPERKLFLGTHGQIKLPFISDKSYAGTSILYQSTSSNDDIPRLDQEPYSKMLFDINTHLEFEPEWMTDIVKKMPLVQTDAPSSVKFDVEYAHSRVAPNKLGRAYIDDFEDSKRSDPLGNDASVWYRASPPSPMRDSLWWYPPAWETFWFSPIYSDDKHRIKQEEILLLSEADKKATQTGINDQPVVRLHTRPAPPDPLYKNRFTKTWTGIMKPIAQSFADKQLMQYFEMFVKAENQFKNSGKLLVQMGTINEDISLDGREPNGREDREDTSSITRMLSYSDNLDLGWDAKPDTAEQYYLPGSTPNTWDAFGYKHPIFGADSLDPSRDNMGVGREYNRLEDNYKNYRYDCREQLNGTIERSEDINGDGVLKSAVKERYFQFTIDLEDSASPYIDNTAKVNPKGGWRKYRIPLRERLLGAENTFDTINSPTWSNITMVRLIWTDFDSTRLEEEQSLVFNNLEFVANQWLELADTVRSKIKSSVINTNEDKFYDSAVSDKRFKNLLTRERDMYGLEEEQSLRLNFKDLKRGDTALVRKALEYQSLDLSGYTTLSLLVYGRKPPNHNDNAVPLYQGDVKFVFRFGSDSLTYYEYSAPIMPEWRNEVTIDLREISKLKDRFMVEYRDSAISIAEGSLRIKAPRGRQPNFANIQWMALGILRDDSKYPEDSLSGEIWVNEMKLSGIRDIIGSASRTELSTQWADLLSMQARMDYESGSFRQMTVTDNRPGSTKGSSSLSATLSLDKFVPGRLGIDVPIGLIYNSSVTRPQLKNETDVFLNDDKGGFVSTFTDAANAMFGWERGSDNALSEAQQHQTVTMGNTYFTGYKKTNRSENPFVSFLADRWGADARYSRNVSTIRYGFNTAKDTLYAKIDTTHNYSGKLNYDLTPYEPPAWTTWSPFTKMDQAWFPSQVKNYELTWLPRKFTVDVADISYSRQRHSDSWRGLNNQQKSYTVRHNTAIEYAPLSPIWDMDYSLGINRNLTEIGSEDVYDKGRYIVRRNDTWKKYMLLWGEKDRTQRWSMNFNPQFVNWLTTSSSYSNDFSSQMTSWLKDPEPLITTDIKSGVTLNGSFDLNLLLTDLKTAAGKSVLATVFETAKKGCEEIGLRSFSLTYTANATMSNNYVSTRLLKDKSILGIKDFMLYQLGIKGRSLADVFTGEMNDRAFLGLKSRHTSDTLKDLYRDDSRIAERSIRMSTSGLQIKPIDLSFRSLGLNYTTNANYYVDSTRNDTTITFPDANIGLSTTILNRLEFVKKNVSNVDLNSTFNYQKTERRTAQTGGSTRTIKVDFMPLLSLGGTLKRWPITFDYRHNYSTEIDMRRADASSPFDTNENVVMHSDEFNLNYSVDQASSLNEIKLLTWTIPIKGRTTIGFKFTRSHENESIKKRYTKNYSLGPTISYIFTDNVTGQAHYTVEERDDGGAKNTSNDFSVEVKITF